MGKSKPAGPKRGRRKAHHVEYRYKFLVSDGRFSKNIPASSSTGKTIAASSPGWSTPPDAPATIPTSVGPDEQPRSPANAISAYMAVPPIGNIRAAMLNVPGQKMPTEKPHNAQPTIPHTGEGANAANR